MDDASAAATYNEVLGGGQRKPFPIGGESAMFQAMMRQKALEAAAAKQPGPGQAQLSPMGMKTPQQLMLEQAQRAEAIRRMQAKMPPQLPPQPPMNPGGGLPFP